VLLNLKVIILTLNLSASLVNMAPLVSSSAVNSSGTRWPL
jgi:hypothetical protein